MQKNLNAADAAVADLIERMSGGAVAPRSNVFHEGLIIATARGLHRLEFRKVSTLLPGIHAQKHAERVRHLSSLASDLHAVGYRFLRVGIEPREELGGAANLDEQVRRAHCFSSSARRVVRRANAALRKAGVGVQVVLSAQHVAVRSGALFPHFHMLVLCAQGVTPDAARDALRELFGKDEFARVAWAPPRIRDFLADAEAVAEHVTYLHGYPISRYVDSGKEEDLTSLVTEQPRAFLAALAALSPKFSLKNLVVSLGAFRAQAGGDSVLVPNTTTDDCSSPIRVVPPSGAVQSEKVCAPKSEALEENPLTVEPPEDFAVGFSPEPNEEEVNAAWFESQQPPLWGVMLTTSLNVPRCPPPRQPWPVRRVSPKVFWFRDDETVVSGFTRRRALLRGCTEMSFEAVAEEFPLHGERWIYEREFTRLRKAGHTVEHAMSLAKVAASAWRAALVEREKARNLAAKFERDARYEREAAERRARERAAWVKKHRSGMTPAEAREQLTAEEIAEWEEEKEKNYEAFLRKTRAEIAASCATSSAPLVAPAAPRLRRSDVQRVRREAIAASAFGRPDSTGKRPAFRALFSEGMAKLERAARRAARVSGQNGR